MPGAVCSFLKKLGVGGYNAANGSKIQDIACSKSLRVFALNLILCFFLYHLKVI